MQIEISLDMAKFCDWKYFPPDVFWDKDFHLPTTRLGKQDLGKWINKKKPDQRKMGQKPN